MSMYHFSDSDAVEHDINTVPETGDFDMVEVDGREYWPVNRDALLELAEECDEMRDNGCSIGSYEVYRIARRIRKACGVVDE